MAKKAIGEKVIISKPDTMYSHFCSTIIIATTAKCFLSSIAVNIVTKEHYSTSTPQALSQAFKHNVTHTYKFIC